MGNSSSSSVNFLNKVTNELQQSNQASSITDCKQKNISFNIGTSLSGCDINLEQRCTATSDASIDSIVAAAQKAWSESATEQKAGIALAINTSTDNKDITSIIKNKITQECSAQAISRLEQEGITYNIETCDAPLTIVNTGDSLANCAIKSLLETVQKAESKSETTQTTDVGMTIAGIIGSLTGPFIVIAIVIIILIIMAPIILMMLPE